MGHCYDFSIKFLKMLKKQESQGSFVSHTDTSKKDERNIQNFPVLNIPSDHSSIHFWVYEVHLSEPLSPCTCVTNSDIDNSQKQCAC